MKKLSPNAIFGSNQQLGPIAMYPKTASLTLLGYLATGGLVHADIVINPDAPRDTALTVPLIAYKSFPQQLFALQKGDRVGFPAELIHRAAEKIPAIRQEAARTGRSVSELTTSEIIALMRSSRESGSARGQSASKTAVRWLEEQEVDAYFVKDLMKSELVEDDFLVYDGSIAGESAQMVSMNEKVVRDFNHVYTNLDAWKWYAASDKAAYFDEINATMAQYPILGYASKFNFSEASFGEIFSLSSAEQNLQIAPALERKYDVYWVEFPMSLYRLDEQDVSEVYFNVFLPEDARALDLIPGHFGYEMQVSRDAKSPEITVGSVSLGEFYSETILYQPQAHNPERWSPGA